MEINKIIQKFLSYTPPTPAGRSVLEGQLLSLPLFDVTPNQESQVVIPLPDDHCASYPLPLHVWNELERFDDKNRFSSVHVLGSGPMLTDPGPLGPLYIYAPTLPHLEYQPSHEVQFVSSEQQQARGNYLRNLDCMSQFDRNSTTLCPSPPATTLRNVRGTNQAEDTQARGSHTNSDTNHSNYHNIEHDRPSPDRPFPCRHHDCGKRFKQKPHRDSHERTVHEKLKSYECYKCLQKFGAKSNLNRHISVKHQDDDDKPRCG